MECLAEKTHKIIKSPWTKEDRVFLEENYKTKTDKEMAERLGRTESAVSQQRYKLGLTVKSKSTTLYLACTPDRYELPLVVTDSLKEMEQLTGYSEASIKSLISRPSTITERSYGYIFRKVQIDK